MNIINREETDTLRQIVLQEINEQRYNRKHIDTKIRAAILGNDQQMDKVREGMRLLSEWLNQAHYKQKAERLSPLKELDAEALVLDIFTGTAYVQRETLFTSVSAQMAARLNFDDTRAAIMTSAELLAVLADTDAFDITKQGRSESLMLVSKLDLPDSLLTFIDESEYLPPMVCPPMQVTHNYASGYLTHNESLLLGKGNHHDGDLCLDAINLMSSVALSVDADFIRSVEERPTFELDTVDRQSGWARFKTQSQRFYALMVNQGNRIYFNYRPDKRGRLYASGYHLNPQGTSFKKAMLELADKEMTQGVPADLTE